MDNKKDKDAKKNNIGKNTLDAIKGGVNKMVYDVDLDENKNGVIDTALIDKNEDGIIEIVAFDENDNFEIFLFDDDLDGNANRAEIDKMIMEQPILWPMIMIKMESGINIKIS